MLFHSLAGSEMQGVIDEMDRRSKGDAPAITSVIDRGETETVGFAAAAAGPEPHFEAGKDSVRGRARDSASRPPVAVQKAPEKLQRNTDPCGIWVGGREEKGSRGTWSDSIRKISSRSEAVVPRRL